MDEDATDSAPPADSEESEEWYSGPYCRHYGDANDCDCLCGNCGHKCWQHREECNECGCEQWEESE